MAMSSLSHELLLALALFGTLFHLLSPALCSNRLPISGPQGMVVEDKNRLGSTPPSCHNRCNACNPCTSVQVPALSSGSTDSVLDSGAVARSYNRCANYKPLGWKCQCGDRLFNP